jgi:hypothetical protein
VLSVNQKGAATVAWLEKSTAKTGDQYRLWYADRAEVGLDWSKPGVITVEKSIWQTTDPSVFLSTDNKVTLSYIEHRGPKTLLRVIERGIGEEFAGAAKAEFESSHGVYFSTLSANERGDLSLVWLQGAGSKDTFDLFDAVYVGGRWSETRKLYGAETVGQSAVGQPSVVLSNDAVRFTLWQRLSDGVSAIFARTDNL